MVLRTALIRYASDFINYPPSGKCEPAFKSRAPSTQWGMKCIVKMWSDPPLNPCKLATLLCNNNNYVNYYNSGTHYSTFSNREVNSCIPKTDDPSSITKLRKLLNLPLEVKPSQSIRLDFDWLYPAAIMFCTSISSVYEALEGEYCRGEIRWQTRAQGTTPAMSPVFV